MNQHAAVAHPHSLRAARALGVLLLVQFILVVAIKIKIGKPADILWMSHVGLLTAAIGFFARKPILVTVALIELLALHSLWLYDFLSWVTGGTFPMGIANYLINADALVWIATAHHFFLLPLLLIAVKRKPYKPTEALLIAIATYLILICACRAFTTPALNINYAFGVRIAWEHWFWEWANRNSNGPFYLLGLSTFVTLVMFAPAYGLVCYWRRGTRFANGLTESTGYMGSSDDVSGRCDSIGSSTTLTT